MNDLAGLLLGLFVIGAGFALVAATIEWPEKGIRWLIAWVKRAL